MVVTVMVSPFMVIGTLAAKLNTAGKPANLIIGGHSHTDVAGPHQLPV